jgi:hypothetical protein
LVENLVRRRGELVGEGFDLAEVTSTRSFSRCLPSLVVPPPVLLLPLVDLFALQQVRLGPDQSGSRYRDKVAVPAVLT